MYRMGSIMLPESLSCFCLSEDTGTVFCRSNYGLWVRRREDRDLISPGLPRLFSPDFPPFQTSLLTGMPFLMLLMPDLSFHSGSLQCS